MVFHIPVAPRARAIVSALIVLLALLLPTAAQNAPPNASVWLAGHQTLQRLDLDTNQIAQTVALSQEAQALAVDPTDGAVWALVSKQLLKFDADGQPALQVDLTSRVPKLDEPPVTRARSL